MKKDSLISENIGKALLLFVLPLIAGSLIQQLYTTVDAVIVGQFTGKVGLAAIDSVHTLFKFPINFMNGLATGATIMISRYFGAKDKEGLHCAVRTALLLAGILGIICAAAGAVFSPWLLDIMSVPEEVRAGSLIYCRIYFGGIWAMILYNMMAGVLRAFGDSKKPLYVLVVCRVVNIVVDLILVGLMHTGVGGAAAATVLSQIVSVVLTAYFLVKSDFLEEKIGIRTMKICKEHMGMMVKKGFPLALQSMLFPIANSIVQASVNTMGTDSIAAWGICDKLDLLIWLIADSMVPVLTTYTTQNLGAGKKERIRPGFFAGGKLLWIICIPFIILYWVAGRYLLLLFMEQSSTSAIETGMQFLKIISPFYMIVSIKLVADGVLRGAGKMGRFMITTFTDLILRVALAILLSAHYGTAGIWSAWPIGWCISTALSVVFFFTGEWNQKKIATI